MLLVTITLYITIISPAGFLVAGPELVIYAVPITAAGLLLTPAAAIAWAMIVTLAILIRAFVVAGMPGITINPIALALSLIVLYVLALATWLFARSLQQANQDLRRRIGQIQTGAEISRVVTAALEPGLIQWPAVQLIQSGFGYYHVGFYAPDPEGRWAVLTEAAGEAAERLRQEGYRLPLDGTTVVAAAFTQRARQMIVVGEEEPIGPDGHPLQPNVHLLPQSRAELALPLQVGERLLGVLDVHSTRPGPFPEEEIEALEGIVGQVAVALENAHLFEDLQQRHQELQELHQQTERRARYLEATAELARAVSSLLDLQTLLDQAVNLISERFGFYHAGIFLVDDAGEWAVLQAANSEGGQRMLARGHKLRVGEQGIVGWVTHAGESRIALDVGEDAVHFDNPDLPDTRSEVALPLKVRDRVIGALDIQSTREAAFSEEDVVVLQTLADQIAVAIENARLFQETQRALEEVQTLHRYYLAQEWEQFTRQRRDLSAEYRRLGVPPLERAWSPEMEIALAQERAVVLSDLEAELLGGDGRGENGGDGAGDRFTLPARSALAVPIKLRGEVVGVLDLQATEEPRRWT
ncbi:MAG: GAF domain-containing protein, partial [Chloroflexi bacterium]